MEPSERVLPDSMRPEGTHRIASVDETWPFPGGESGPEPRPAAGTMMPPLLTTPVDSPADRIQAGQALHRMLLRAAAGWVFASLHSQPTESAEVRAELCSGLGLGGYPQLVLQCGRANTAASTARRPAGHTLIIDRQSW